MRRGLLSLAATVLAIPVLYGAATGRLGFEAAALRMVVLAAAVSILDRYAWPVMEAVLRTLAAPEDAHE